MELLWAISDGSRTDMDAWNAKSVEEFFMGLWIHQDKIADLMARIKKTNSTYGPGQT